MVTDPDGRRLPQSADWTLHHLGVATLDAHREVPTWATLGYMPISDLIHDPVQRVRVLFLGNGIAGSPLVELVEPAADDSPVRRFVGGTSRFYHLCFEVDDIEAALRRIKEARWLVVQPPLPAVAYHRRLIAWCYTPSRDLVELLERERSSGKLGST